MYVCYVCNDSLTTAAKLQSHLLSHAHAGIAPTPGASVSISSLTSATVSTATTEKEAKEAKETKEETKEEKDQSSTLFESVPAPCSPLSAVSLPTLSSLAPATAAASTSLSLSPSSDMQPLALVPSTSLGGAAGELSVAGDGAGWDDDVEAAGVVRDAVLLALTCGECNASFWSKPGYDQHVRAHAADKPFACDYTSPAGVACTSRFVSRAMLSQHIVVHATVVSNGGAPLFVCEWCSTSFNRKGNWQRHVRLATCAPKRLTRAAAAAAAESASASSSAAPQPAAGPFSESILESFAREAASEVLVASGSAEGDREAEVIRAIDSMASPLSISELSSSSSSVSDAELGPLDATPPYSPDYSPAYDHSEYSPASSYSPSYSPFGGDGDDALFSPVSSSSSSSCLSVEEDVDYAALFSAPGCLAAPTADSLLVWQQPVDPLPLL